VIKRKKKICKKCGQEKYIYARGLCQYCYNGDRNHGKLAVSRKSNTKIPQATPSRLNRLYTYKSIIGEMDAQEVIRCFFCGVLMQHPEEHHHLMGRDGDLLTNRKYIQHTHQACHKQYHNDSVHLISWFDGYLSRLMDIDFHLYHREKLRKEK